MNVKGMFGCRLGAGLALLLAVGYTWSLPLGGQTKYVSVAKAQCGPGSRPETGLQGQTTAAERFSPAGPQASNCNLEPIGQFQGEGAAWDMGVDRKSVV